MVTMLCLLQLLLSDHFIHHLEKKDVELARSSLLPLLLMMVTMRMRVRVMRVVAMMNKEDGDGDDDDDDDDAPQAAAEAAKRASEAEKALSERRMVLDALEAKVCWSSDASGVYYARWRRNLA